MSASVNLLLQYIFNAIYTAMWFAVLNMTHTKRYSRGVTYLIQALWFMFCRFVMVNLPFMSEIRVVMFITIFLLVCQLCYKDPWTKVLFSSASVHMVVITNELIGVGLYFPEQVKQGAMETLSVSEMLAFWGIYLCFGAALLFLLYLFLNRNKFSLSAGNWSMFAIFPVSQFVLMYGWLDSLRLAGGGRTLMFSLVMLACILADIGLFAAVTRIAQRAQLAAENDMLAAQLELQEQHYKDLTAQYENIRRMRHDIANHMNAVQGLLTSGRSNDAREYLEELNASPLDSTLGICENPVVDAFLHNRIEAARAAGVDVELGIDLAAGLPVSNVDLICIFGNLIDNALEACAGLEKPKLLMTCNRAHGCLIIITKNSVNPENRTKSPKVRGLDRGIGKLALSRVAEKYNGSVSFSENENVFTAELIIGIGV